MWPAAIASTGSRSPLQRGWRPTGKYNAIEYNNMWRNGGLLVSTKTRLHAASRDTTGVQTVAQQGFQKIPNTVVNTDSVRATTSPSTHREQHIHDTVCKEQNRMPQRQRGSTTPAEEGQTRKLRQAGTTAIEGGASPHTQR